MSYSPQGSVREQMRFLKRQFLQDGGLPFTDILSEELVSQALKAIDGFLDRIYSPLVTLWVFLGQVLSADPSCRAAVARLMVHRISRKQKPCSAETGAYCQARKRLPEKFFSDAARQTGSALETNAKEDWLWKWRRVFVYDGSTVSMPDTPENQAGYHSRLRRNPESDSQWPASQRSSRSPVARCSIWESAATQARGKVNWGCYAHCGTSFVRATLCWLIA